MAIIEIGFWTLLGTAFYVYAGYPILLWIVRVIRGRDDVDIAEIEPTVTFVISAFNECEVIDGKLENTVTIDYPSEKLDIVVVSDASDDGTDQLVEDFVAENVRLLRMDDRGGKTLGLNAAVASSSAEILVFSDANAMYDPQSIRVLVRNFNDRDVGAVVGESTYEDSTSDAEESESSYWQYETAMKRLESAIGSVVGGDGAIYAIRREHYRPMSADALSDFVNPLQIVKRGHRCIYEPAAISVESAAGSFEKEFRRKVRIVNRAWRATFSMPELLNPLQHGFFAIQLISHKLLRWLMPFIMILTFVTNAMLVGEGTLYGLVFLGQIAFYAVAIAGALLRQTRQLPAVVYIPFYFCLVNIAAGRGILEAYRGKTYTTWSTARSDDGESEQ